jgi:ribosomal protein L11 methyltransferase
MALERKSILTFKTEAEAEAACALLSEIRDDAPYAVNEAHGIWRLECYDDGALASDAGLHALLGEAQITPLAPVSIEAIPDADWVALSQQGLAPVRAGAFLVHGSHDVWARPYRFSIEIDAGRAFGTAHHATTRGCLIAIQRVTARRRVRRALDLGTGSGVLAIAIAKASGHRASILGLDIDPVAVEVARANCRLNGVQDAVRLAVSGRPQKQTADGFDLITANILARPLIALSGAISQSASPRGSLILSGILEAQAREVIGAYLARGFCKVEVFTFEGWTTAILQRRGRRL